MSSTKEESSLSFSMDSGKMCLRKEKYICASEERKIMIVVHTFIAYYSNQIKIWKKINFP
jgi:hypothetical protein